MVDSGAVAAARGPEGEDVEAEEGGRGLRDVVMLVQEVVEPRSR